MKCACGAIFYRVHPERNVCSCGAVYDGSGNLISGTPKEKAPSCAKWRFKRTGRSQKNIFKNKPGSALESLIPDWAVQFKGNCSCKDMAEKMNRWETAGCKLREKEIVLHLEKQSDRLIAVFRGMPKSLRKIAARRLFAKAIKLSEADLPSDDQRCP